jgi:hypothetical protein
MQSDLPFRNDFPVINKPSGCRDLTTLLIDTYTRDIMTTSPSAVFTFGQFRQCTESRAEAIMSVVGATDWYRTHVAKTKTAPSEANLVLGLYPLPFVSEAAKKLGPTFYTAIPSELQYLQSVVDLSRGHWEFTADPHPVGSLLPFSKGPGYFHVPTAPLMAEQHHPAVREWEICRDGSVTIKKAGILTLSSVDEAEAIVFAPLYDGDETIHYDTPVRQVEAVDLGGWLADFEDPDRAPNYAVSLYQMTHFNNSVGLHVGLLLKSCGNFGAQTKLVKVGIFFTKAVGVCDVHVAEVDWVVL